MYCTASSPASPEQEFNKYKCLSVDKFFLNIPELLPACLWEDAASLLPVLAGREGFSLSKALFQLYWWSWVYPGISARSLKWPGNLDLSWFQCSVYWPGLIPTTSSFPVVPVCSLDWHVSYYLCLGMKIFAWDMEIKFLEVFKIMPAHVTSSTQSWGLDHSSMPIKHIYPMDNENLWHYCVEWTTISAYLWKSMKSHYYY